MVTEEGPCEDASESRKARWETSGETIPRDILLSNLEPPEQSENKFLLSELQVGGALL